MIPLGAFILALITTTICFAAGDGPPPEKIRSNLIFAGVMLESQPASSTDGALNEEPMHPGVLIVSVDRRSPYILDFVPGETILRINDESVDSSTQISTLMTEELNMIGFLTKDNRHRISFLSRKRWLLCERDWHSTTH